MNLLMSFGKLDDYEMAVKLSKELEKRGYKITQISSGDDLEYPKGCSYSEILKLVKDESIDLIHSHTQEPTPWLNKIHKKTKIPMVTTLYGCGNKKFAFKRSNEWGEKVLTLNNDIKKYLLENYKLKDADVFITSSGIDTEKFSKNIDKTAIAKELGIYDNDNVISYICKDDKSANEVGTKLIEAILKLDNIVENIKCFIVGNCDDIKAAQKAANDSIGREAIMLLSERDISKVIAMSKLVIGSNDIALCAMASEKPVILASNEGYIGLFGEDKTETGILSGLSCKGALEVTADALAQDIGVFFGLWEEEWQKLGKYGKEVVEKYYSVAKMADDAIKVYHEILEGKV